MINIKQIKIHFLNDNKDYLEKEICSKLKIKKDNLVDYHIIRRSIDARKDLYIVYEVDVNIKGKYYHSKDVSIAPNRDYNYHITGSNKLSYRPIIVGSGPSGLFCAYLLALNNYQPIIIERGNPVEERIKDVNEFWNNNNLNINSNISFGEGGAGTFSDGKLNTLVKDQNNRIHFMMETFIKFGVPKEILYDHQPHIGTDILQKVIVNMRKEIIKLGGEFKFNTCLTNLVIENSKVIGIEVNNKDIIKTDVLVLAIGHSARDTFKMLNENKVVMENKPFAVGFRIQIDQNIINENQYGKYANLLPPASFKLTNNINGRGIYSFCMCPGGYVINASSEKERLVINGMSNYLRDSGNANAAIIVTVNENDYGHNLFDGMNYQELLEKKAYMLGKGLIPTSTLGDYFNNRECNSLGKLKPMFKGSYSLCNLNNLLSSELNNCLKESINIFNKRINGFNNSDNIISGIESRTSSPIKIIRDDSFESSIHGIYPIGEGAGYAGGITTSAVDGIKLFEKLITIFKN